MRSRGSAPNASRRTGTDRSYSSGRRLMVGRGRTRGNSREFAGKAVMALALFRDRMGNAKSQSVDADWLWLIALPTDRLATVLVWSRAVVLRLLERGRLYEAAALEPLVHVHQKASSLHAWGDVPPVSRNRQGRSLGQEWPFHNPHDIVTIIV